MSRLPTLALMIVAAAGVFVSTQVGQARSGEHRIAQTARRPTVAPLSVRVPKLAGTARVGSVITAGTGIWKHHPSHFAYQWVRCTARGANCAPIRGARGTSIRIKRALLGGTVRVRVTATNRVGSAAAASSMTYRIAPGPPAAAGPAAAPAGGGSSNPPSSGGGSDGGGSGGGGSGGGGSGGATPPAPTPSPAPPAPSPVSGLWWAPSSFWNQPIPAGASLDANSQTWTNMLLASSTVQSIYINSDYWTVNVYHATSSTPTASITVQNTGGKHITIPYQAAWKGTPDSDAHLAVIDDSTGCEYEFQGFDANTQSAVAIEINNIQTGSGAHINDSGVGGGALSLLGGLITPHDISSGSINHALRIATPINSPNYVLPGTVSDGTHAGGIPEGQLLRLDPSLDLSQYNLNPFQTIVAKALQTYGAYDSDSASALTLNTESTFDGSTYNPTPSPLPKTLINHLQFLNPLYTNIPLGTNTTPGCAQLH